MTEKRTVRFFESGASYFKENEKKEGLYYYMLRDTSEDDSNSYNIEDYCMCNNIGSMVCDYDVLEGADTWSKKGDRFMDADEVFEKFNMDYDPSLTE